MMSGGGDRLRREGSDLIARYMCPAYHDGTDLGNGKVRRGLKGLKESSWAAPEPSGLAPADSALPEGDEDGLASVASGRSLVTYPLLWRNAASLLEVSRGEVASRVRRGPDEAPGTSFPNRLRTARSSE